MSIKIEAMSKSDNASIENNSYNKGLSVDQSVSTVNISASVDTAAQKIEADALSISKAQPASPIMAKSVGAGQVDFKIGYSPYVDDETGHWFQYDDKQKKYVDTGISAYGSSLEDYNPLINKPRINDVELIDNKTLDDLHHSALSNTEIESMLSL